MAMVKDDKCETVGMDTVERIKRFVEVRRKKKM